MKRPFKTGLSFGLTSGIITTLGLIIGLHSGTHSTLAIISGILTIAIADALGIHISEESESKHTEKEIWEATVSTFLFKFIFTISFILPVLLFELTTAIFVSVIWGLSLLSMLSYQMAKKQKKKAWEVVGEHLVIALIVIALTHLIGDWISLVLG